MKTGARTAFYLGGIGCLRQLETNQVLDVMLETALLALCDLRDDCDDPYTCLLAAACPRAARVRRWRVYDGHRVARGERMIG